MLAVASYFSLFLKTPSKARIYAFHDQLWAMPPLYPTANTKRIKMTVNN